MNWISMIISFVLGALFSATFFIYNYMMSKEGGELYITDDSIYAVMKHNPSEYVSNSPYWFVIRHK